MNTISHLTDNPETSNKVHVKSIFEYNNKNINVLPKIKKNSDEYDHGRYFYRDTNTLSRAGSNFGEKINNFRSNNIIKNKENKECSLFQTLRKSSENGTNYKYCLSLYKLFPKENFASISSYILSSSFCFSSSIFFFSSFIFKFF